MSHLKTNIVLLSLLALLVSCSKQSKTPVTFKLTLGAIANELSGFSEGGALIAGQKFKDDGTLSNSFVRVLTTTSDLNESVLNGNWKIYAISWQGGNNGSFTGDVYCAESPLTTVTGAPVTISLTVSNATCSLASFRGSFGTITRGTGKTGFLTPQMTSCKSLPGANNTNCLYEPTTIASPNLKGLATGFKFSIKSSDYTPETGLQYLTDSLSSNCLAVSSTNSGEQDTNYTYPNKNIDPTTLNIPTSTEFLLGLRVHVFAASTQLGTSMTNPCDTNYEKKIITLPQGLGVAPSLGFSDQFRSYGNGQKLRTYTVLSDDEICSGNNILPTQFATGYGTTGFPFAICNIDQFNLISDENNYTWGGMHSTKSFKLLKKLNAWYNLNLSDIVLAQSQVKLMNMIGTQSIEETTPYTGTFDGNGKSIIGFSFQANTSTGPLNQLGFIRYLGTTGILTNVNFFGSEISGVRYNPNTITSNDVGVVVGYSQGSVTQVTSDRGRVEGDTLVGGLVGKADVSATLSQGITSIKINNTIIRANTIAGGIAGEFKSGNKQNALIRAVVNNGSITSDNPSANPNYFGGLVGKMIECTTVTSSHASQAKADVDISGYSDLGGLFGKLDAECKISDMYTTSSVTAASTNTYANTGGAIGSVGSNVSLSRILVSQGAVVHDGTTGKNAFVAGSTQPTTCDANFVSNVSGVTGSCFTNKTYLDVRLSSTYSTPWSTAWNSLWRMDDDTKDLPRLAWEDQRDCHGKFSTVSGNGTVENPFQICSREQLGAIIVDPANNLKFAKLMMNIDFFGATASVSDLNLNLDGDGKMLANYSNSASFFSEIKPNITLRNMLVRNFSLTGSSMNNGLLVTTNNGLIELVNAQGTATGMNGIGGLVGKNNGVIAAATVNTKVTPFYSSGGTAFGGIVGQNTGGLIWGSQALGNIIIGSTATQIGGIAGNNAGSISTMHYPLKYFNTSIIPITGNGAILESRFNGKITLNGSGNSSIGGIVGRNINSTPLPKIEDCHSEFTFEDNNAANISPNANFGGIAGSCDNSSIIIQTSIGNVFPYLSYIPIAGNFYSPISNNCSVNSGIYFDSETSRFVGIWDKGTYRKVIQGSGVETNDPTSNLFYAHNPESYNTFSLVIADDLSDVGHIYKWKLIPTEASGAHLKRAEDLKDNDFLNFIASKKDEN